MKQWYLSKTIWVNLLTLLVGLFGYLLGQEVVQDYPTMVSVLVALQGAVNIILRLVTSKPIGGSDA